MKKIIFIVLMGFNMSLLAQDLVCMGNSNQNQLIQIQVKLDKKLGTVELESQKYELSISNDFMHVWQNTIEGQLYTNSLSRLDGSLTVIAENVMLEGKPQPLVRAVLMCKNKADLVF